MRNVFKYNRKQTSFNFAFAWNVRIQNKKIYNISDLFTDSGLAQNVDTHIKSLILPNT